MLLVIDNFDSFTYNLVQYFGELGVEQQVYRNNAITVEEALALNPDRYRRGAKGTGKLRREYWFLEHDNHLVWGATASILHSLACVVRTAQAEW